MNCRKIMNKTSQNNLQKKCQKQIIPNYFKRVKIPFLRQLKNQKYQYFIQEKELVLFKSQKNSEIIAYILNFCSTLVLSPQQKKLQVINSIKKQLISPSLDLSFIQNAPNIYSNQSINMSERNDKNKIQTKQQISRNFIIQNKSQNFKRLILQIFNQLLQIQYSNQQKSGCYLICRIWRVLQNPGIILMIIFIRSILYFIFQVNQALWYDRPIKNQVLNSHLNKIFYNKNESKRSSRVKDQIISQVQRQIKHDYIAISEIFIIDSKRLSQNSKDNYYLCQSKEAIILSQRISNTVKDFKF